MKKIFLLIVLLFAGGAVYLNVTAEDKSLHNKASFADLFQAAGNITSSVDRSIGTVLPISDMDEKQLGEEIKKHYREYNYPHMKEKREYVNSVLQGLKFAKGKRFEYEVFVEESYDANAYALPGGAIVVTEPLLMALGSESELAAVLAHEVGHIENSHCYDAVKYKLLAQKVGADKLGQIIDGISSMLVRHSYSKTQEAESDEYAFELLKQSKYDVMGLPNSFQSLLDFSRRNDTSGDIFADYFQSHPKLTARVAEFSAKGKAWKARHSGEKRYIGKQNLWDKVSLEVKDYGPAEWTE